MQLNLKLFERELDKLLHGEILFFFFLKQVVCSIGDMYLIKRPAFFKNIVLTK